jgi:hypothetical protein
MAMSKFAAALAAFSLSLASWSALAQQDKPPVDEQALKQAQAEQRAAERKAAAAARAAAEKAHREALMKQCVIKPVMSDEEIQKCKAAYRA